MWVEIAYSLKHVLGSKNDHEQISRVDR